MTLPDNTETGKFMHSSPFARVSLVAYLFLILYASWYPFAGWRANNLSALPDVIRAWPRYWTTFHVGTNIVGYIPFDTLIVFSLYPRVNRWRAVLVAIVFASTVSATAELVQYFIPSRVTSLLDFLTNAGGATIGAVVGAMLTPLIIEKGRLQLLRKQWTFQESSREIVILGLWPMAQLYPQAYLFDMDINLSTFLLQGIEPDADIYLLAEALITACGCTGAILICLSLLNRHAPKLILSLLLLIMAVVCKSLASALLFNPEYAFAWFTPGARGGLVISMIMLYGFSFAPVHVQKRLAMMLLLIYLVVVNLLPDNPYFEVTMQAWVQGKFLNFNGAAQFLSLFWPFLALWALLRKPRPVAG